MNEKFIDSPRSCRNSANHLSNTRVSPPLPFLSGSCRNSANNITAMKLSYVSPCGMILLNLPLSFRQVETLQLEETKQTFFFSFFRGKLDVGGIVSSVFSSDYETVIRLPGSRLSRFISSPLVFSFSFFKPLLYAFIDIVNLSSFSFVEMKSVFSSDELKRVPRVIR